MTLTPAQSRLLSFLARYPVMHGREELGRLKLLRDGDAAEVDALAAMDLVIVGDGYVRISGVGQVKAEEEGSLGDGAGRLRDVIESGVFFHEPPK